MGKPVLSILPFLLLGFKTFGVIAGVTLLLFILYSILSPTNNENEEIETNEYYKKVFLSPVKA